MVRTELHRFHVVSDIVGGLAPGRWDSQGMDVGLGLARGGC
jgi:hypothetical protein